jgi:predicted secreted protein
VSSDARPDVVELKVGERHPVRLAGLGTAGYRWVPVVEGDQRVVDVTDAGVAELANGRIGTSADELFTIQAMHPGVTRVRFAQRRPWESEDEPAANEYVVEIRITSTP